MNLFNLTPFLVAITHLTWVSGWWAFGHFIYLIGKGCSECMFTDYAFEDFFGGFLAFGASYTYCYIGYYVINALYKGELPDGSPIGNMEKMLKSMMNQPNRKEKRKK